MKQPMKPSNSRRCTSCEITFKLPTPTRTPNPRTVIPGNTVTTRFAKVVLLATFLVETAAVAVWTSQQALPTQIGLLMGTVVGYMAMGVFVAAVAAVIVTILVVGLPRLAAEVLQVSGY